MKKKQGQYCHACQDAVCDLAQDAGKVFIVSQAFGDFNAAVNGTRVQKFHCFVGPFDALVVYLEGFLVIIQAGYQTLFLSFKLDAQRNDEVGLAQRRFETVV